MAWDVSKLKKPDGVAQSWWDEQIALAQREIKLGSLVAGGEDAAIRRVQEKFKNPETIKAAFAETATDAQKEGLDTPESVEGRVLDIAEKSDAENKKAWEDLAGLPLDQLASRLGLSDVEAKAAHDRFVEAVNAYQIPEIPPELGAIVSEAAQAAADPDSIAAQKRALGKVEALTGIEETAEERFMREQARRKQERDLRGQREADKSSLLARGAYGSGAEIAMNANAQQEAAERRSLEELGAGANAQRRALQAIGQMGEISGQMRDQSFDESYKRGSAADTVRNWNRAYSEDHARWVRGEKVKDEEGKVERAGFVRDSETDRIRGADERAGRLWGARLNLTEGTTGNRTSGAAPVISALTRTGTRLYNRGIAEKLDEEGGGFLGDDGILGIKGLPLL